LYNDGAYNFLYFLHQANKHGKRPKIDSKLPPIMSTNSAKETKPPIAHGPAAPKTIEQMRAERLKREQQERSKETQLLAKLRGDVKLPKPAVDEGRRYNSQFNPDFVRRPKQPHTNDRR